MKGLDARIPKMTMKTVSGIVVFELWPFETIFLLKFCKTRRNSQNEDKPIKLVLV